MWIIEFIAFHQLDNRCKIDNHFIGANNHVQQFASSNYGFNFFAAFFSLWADIYNFFKNIFSSSTYESTWTRGGVSRFIRGSISCSYFRVSLDKWTDTISLKNTRDDTEIHRKIAQTLDNKNLQFFYSFYVSKKSWVWGERGKKTSYIVCLTMAIV